MRIIKTKEDIDILQEAEVISKDYLESIETYFLQLYEVLGEGCKIEDFNLNEHGYLVILEKGDNATGEPMRNVGLNPEDYGLLGSAPEFVEEIKLENRSVYKINVLYTNDFMMTFYSEVGIHSQEVEEWLEDENA